METTDQSDEARQSLAKEAESPPAPSEDAPLIGQLLGERFDIEDSLARGGMATVYLARDRENGEAVVLKTPHTQLMTDAAFRRRFEQEIQQLSRFTHPGIVGITAWGEHEGLPYAVMPYLTGGNLHDRLAAAGGQQSAAEVLEWLPSVATALDFLHEGGALHRDVKPANILFDDDRPVLSDFGIATAIGAADPQAPTQEVRPDLTVVGSFVGSPAYAPPEAIDRLFTPAYDQYSLATVVYLALAGELPFAGATNEAFLIAKEKSPAPALVLEEHNQRTHPNAAAALARALSQDPQARFASCTDFAAAFASAVKRRPSLPITPWKLAAFAAATLAALAFAFFLPSAPLAPPIGPAVPTEPRIEPRPTTEAPPPGTATEVPGRFPQSILLGSRPAEVEAALRTCRADEAPNPRCTVDAFLTERPRRIQFERGFALDRHETTNAEFAAFVRATHFETVSEGRGYSWHEGKCRGCYWREIQPNRSAADYPDHPVVHVAWADARAYCRWRGARLPTENEWELAARGQARRIYPWGDEWDAARVRLINPDGSTTEGRTAVASSPGDMTPDGFADLAASVSEWTATPSLRGGYQQVKGGSWRGRGRAAFRTAQARATEPDYASSDLGFRCAEDLQPLSAAID